MFRQLPWTMYCALGVCLFAGNAVAGADEPGEKQNVQIDAGNAKTQVLAWLDDYRQDQVLFHDEDIAKLRKELEDDTPEEAMRWWSKTAKMREALESPQWKETRVWFGEFLKVQAIFSDQQIDELRVKAKDAAKQDSSKEFKDILSEIERYRSNLVQGSADAKALREHKLQVLDAYQKESAEQRAPAAQAAAFGTINSSQPVVRREPRHAAAPLINSLDVARWSVMRNFWRY